jgi:hypothetical protein
MAMDEPVRLMYRKLLQTGFEYAGSIENPSIFLTRLKKGYESVMLQVQVI